MRELRGEVGKKIPKKRWVIPHFYDITWLTFETLCPVPKKGSRIYNSNKYVC